MLSVIMRREILKWIRSERGGASATIVGRLRGRTYSRVLRSGVSPLPRAAGALFYLRVRVRSEFQNPGLRGLGQSIPGELVPVFAEEGY